MAIAPAPIPWARGGPKRLSKLFAHRSAMTLATLQLFVTKIREVRFVRELDFPILLLKRSIIWKGLPIWIAQGK
jgi:hypothetical protein